MQRDEVKIDEQYKVEIDEMNHTLLKFQKGGEDVSVGKYVGSKTKDKWKSVGHYPNMEQALGKVIQLKLIDDESITDVESYLNRLKELNEKFVNEFKGQ